MRGTEFLDFVWSHQYSEGVAAIAVMEEEDGEWHESTFDLRKSTGMGELVTGLDEFFPAGWMDYRGNWATYFCPNLFFRRRKKEQCMPGSWLYQDLDDVSPSSCPIKPTLWWETSPGRYQALWLMEEALPPAELAPLNKALNRACGADKGTWNLTRMLRVPGTPSGKRDCWVSEAFFFDEVKPEEQPPEWEGRLVS